MKKCKRLHGRVKNLGSAFLEELRYFCIVRNPPQYNWNQGGISLSSFTLKVAEVNSLLFLHFEGQISHSGNCGFPRLWRNSNSTQGRCNDAEVVL